MNLIVSIGSILAGALCILTAFDSCFHYRGQSIFWAGIGVCAVIAGMRG